MGSVRIGAVFAVLVICATDALHFGENTKENMEVNSTDVEAFNQMIARRKAYETYLLLSPYPRNDCVDTYAPPDNDFKANELMDMALEYFRNIIRKQNIDRMPIPDFEESFKKKVGFVKVKGSFKGKSGWLESILSVARKGNANVRLNGTSVILDSTLGLNVLRLGMDYTAKLSFISVKGKLDAQVRSNALSFSGGLDYSTGNCRLFLQSFTVIELGKIDVHVTGLGELNWLYSKIVTWVTSRLHTTIKDTVEKQIKGILEKELSKVKCPVPPPSY